MSDSMDMPAIDSAIARAQEALFRAQDPDGPWRSWCDQGPAATAQVLVGLAFVDALDPHDASEAGRWLVGQQRGDGSFVAHPFASTGDLSATAYAWAGLRATGLTEDAEPVKRARQFVEAHGGMDALIARMQTGDFVALFLVMMNLLPADALPEPPQLFALLPPVERFVEQRFSVQMPFMLLQAGVLLHFLRGDWGTHAEAKGLLGTLESRRCLELLDAYQNEDGSWMFGDTLHAALSLATLHAMGIPRDDPRASRGRKWLDGQKRRDDAGLWFSIFQADIWATAFTARGLLRSGVAASDPVIARAVRWLVKQQIASREPATVPSSSDAVAWAFQAGNTRMADCDDAGVVLASLGMSMEGLADETLRAGARAATGRSISWLHAMQDRDGGWASFQHGLPGKAPGPMMTGAPAAPGDGLWAKLRFFLNPPPELGDPATEDVTGRVLLGLGNNGYDASSPEIEKAIGFLRAQQCESGAWWGRWVVNYLAGTSWVLRGLAAVRVDLGAAWIAKGIRFLLDHQNGDGGWGEAVDSYRDERLAGIGPSSPGLTGLVLTALIDTGSGADVAIEAGVRYLLAAQRTDGGFSNATLLHALVPPDLYYVLPGTADQLALEALGAYRSWAKAR